MSYRRNCLKQAFRESFSIIKYFTHSIYPELVDENGDEVGSVEEEEEEEEGDIEARELISQIRDGAQVGVCIDLCSEKERY